MKKAEGLLEGRFGAIKEALERRWVHDRHSVVCLAIAYLDSCERSRVRSLEDPLSDPQVLQ